MKFSTSTGLLGALSVASSVSGAPHGLRQAAANANLVVLQFANILNQLEESFYSQAISKFQASDFTSAGFSNAQVPLEQIQTIAIDEKSHISAFESAIVSLGAQPVTSCSFDLSSVLTDIPTVLATARVVENVGVSAFLGAANLLTDPSLLTAAASVLTIEARHQTMLNMLSTNGKAIPQPFDIPFTPSEVLAIAGPLISGCDTGIPANPSLTVTNKGVAAGTTLTFTSSAINGTSNTSGMFCQLLVGGAPESTPLPFSSCTIPSGSNGPMAVWITSDGQPLAASSIQRATSQLVAGPALMFIDDVKADALNSLVVVKSS